MKKWYVCLFTAALLISFLSGYYVITSPVNKSYYISATIFNGTNPLELINAGVPPAIPTPGNASQLVSAEAIVAHLFVQRNFTNQEKNSLHTWNHLKHLINDTQVLPNAVEAIKEASVAWGDLVASVEEETLRRNENSSKRSGKQKQCPQFVSKMVAAKLDGNGFKLRVPCGLTQDSLITFIAIPNGLVGNFRVDLTGEPLPGEPDPPIILHWDEKERWQSSEKEKDNKAVNELYQNKTIKAYMHANGTEDISTVNDGKPRTYYPFEHNELFVATFRIGLEGIHMRVDGKHITSFAYHETLEPRLVREVRISGDLNLSSVVASGLPTTEDLEHSVDLGSLKAVPINPRRQLDLFIGVFSTANYFHRRMAVRRTWMQYPEVRSGQVAVRFFVGLDKNKMANEELWKEARMYGDIQLMPFVDYYSLIIWKTIAICNFGTEVVSAKFIMKADDDTFVRVDEILSSLGRTNVTRGLLYGHISSDSQPGRYSGGKWYISYEEWPEDTYPPFAHGPGYVLSNDIARTIAKKHRKGQLKMFKLEDVGMGIWIADMKKKGLDVKYEHDERFIHDGCKDGYVLAHYQNPRLLLCMWQKIQETKSAICCGTDNSYNQ